MLNSTIWIQALSNTISALGVRTNNSDGSRPRATKLSSSLSFRRSDLEPVYEFDAGSDRSRGVHFLNAVVARQYFRPSASIQPVGKAGIVRAIGAQNRVANHTDDAR